MATIIFMGFIYEWGSETHTTFSFNFISVFVTLNTNSETSKNVMKFVFQIFWKKIIHGNDDN